MHGYFSEEVAAIFNDYLLDVIMQRKGTLGPWYSVSHCYIICKFDQSDR
jgi:hypothetical protein